MMDSDQDSASLPDSLSQISIGRDALATTATGSAEDLPTLLSVPLEIRRSIYQYFLQADKNANADDKSDLPHFDLVILHLCRQLRFEGTDYLAKNNLWVQLSISHDQEDDIRGHLWASPRIPYHLLTLQERQRLLCEKAVCIQLGGATQVDMTVQGKKREQYLIFGYSAASYARISDDLVRMRRTEKIALSITVAPKYSTRNHAIVENLILPFAVARDTLAVPDIMIAGLSNLQLSDALIVAMNQVNESPRHFQDHLLALKEEGNKFFVRGHLGAAGTLYNSALGVYNHFNNSSFLPVVSTPGEMNVVRSIFTDILNNWVNTSNIMVSRLRSADGLLPKHSLSMIVDTYTMSQHLFNWVGMSDQQRQKAHYRCAVAARNLAEYCSAAEHVEYMHMFYADAPTIPDSNPDYLLRVATRQYYCAWKADVHSRSAPSLEDLYHKMQRKHKCFTEDPDLFTVRAIPGYGSGIWEGDPFLIKRRTPDEMRRDLLLSVPREDKSMTKEGLKQMKQDLGMPGDQLDGLVRLLRPAETEITYAQA